MYSPPYNRVEARAGLLEFMRTNNFVLLVTGRGGNLHGSHLPAMADERGEALVIDMHMARANPQWREFGDPEVLVVFSGPHAYISPRWYEEEERVPTWNYAAVHAYGKPKLIEDRQAKHASQRRLIAALDNFEIAVTRLETRWKLSQNRSVREQELIAAQLEKSDDSLARSLAALTRQHLVDE
ncbi:MAG: hypothetical protein AUG50_02135 [Betaproteobacteria bacterium 13_1_20CM_3_63_8]|nr:MAG: hypothetical protein AUG50_02135 [Betaproteobacteria bacterium 13_1_20CM_3_63_8]